jgi:hypothetical protein
MQDKEQLNPEDLQVPQLTTTPAETEEVKTEEYSVEEMEVLKANLQETLDELDKDDHDKKNYIKISDTFYIQPIVKEEDEEEELDEDGKVKEFFKILNPETDELETRELTDEEKKEILIVELKRDRIRFHPTKNPVRTTETVYVEKKYGKKTIKVKEKTKGVVTNETVNQFGAEYKQKRKRKNKQRKTSRKANR